MSTHDKLWTRSKLRKNSDKKYRKIGDTIIKNTQTNPQNTKKKITKASETKTKLKKQQNKIKYVVQRKI